MAAAVLHSCLRKAPTARWVLTSDDEHAVSTAGIHKPNMNMLDCIVDISHKQIRNCYTHSSQPPGSHRLPTDQGCCSTSNGDNLPVCLQLAILAIGPDTCCCSVLHPRLFSARAYLSHGIQHELGRPE